MSKLAKISLGALICNAISILILISIEYKSSLDIGLIVLSWILFWINVVLFSFAYGKSND
jgi:hypothetical protein